MPRHTSPAAAPGLPKSSPPAARPCPIAPLAAEACLVIDAFNRLDGEHSTDLSLAADIRRRAQLAALQHRLDGIQDYASHLLAQSAQGAHFQLLLAFDIVEADKHTKQNRDAVKRMLWSVITFIETTTGVGADDVTRYYYMAPQYNPHILADEAIAVGGLSHA